MRMAAQPPQVVLYPADNSIPRVGQPLVIVCHDTEGIDSRSTLKHGDGRGVSVHCLIQKFPRRNGTTDVLPTLPSKHSGALIYRMVPDERGANHAGYATWTHKGKTYSSAAGHTNVNAISLSFELECLGSKNPSDHYTDEQLLAAGWLISTWRYKYGPLPLVRHAEIDAGRRSDTFNLTVAQLEKWANAAAVVYGFEIPNTPKPYTVKGLPVYQRSDRTGPLWGHLLPGEQVAIDDVSNGHLADSRGFVDIAGLEAL